jgi:hypothetical protein
VRFNRLIIISGVIITGLGITGMVWNIVLRRAMATPYSFPLLRAWQEERIRRYPILILFIGISLLLCSLFTSGKLRLPAFKVPWKTLLAVIIMGGILMSLREWRYYGSPVWDGYGDFSRHFYYLIFHPGDSTFEAFNIFIQKYAHAGSPLGPFMIGLLNGLFRNITLSYMILMILSTLGTAVILRKILLLFYQFSPQQVIEYLVLFFSNCVVMRSMAFPQMDALVMFWTTLALYLAYLYLFRGRYIHLILASVVITGAILTKVNGFFLIPIIPIAYIIITWRKERFRLGELMRILLYVSVIPLSIFVGFLKGFNILENFLHELSLRGVIDTSGIRFDRNLILFFITFLIAFQIYSYLILAKENLRSKKSLPPLLTIIVTVLFLLLGSAPFFLRFFLPIIPAILLLSISKLESIRYSHPQLVNLLIVWTITFNYLVLVLHLYY